MTWLPWLGWRARVQCLKPLVLLGGLHMAAITDLAWSADGSSLAISSQVRPAPAPFCLSGSCVALPALRGYQPGHLLAGVRVPLPTTSSFQCPALPG